MKTISENTRTLLAAAAKRPWCRTFARVAAGGCGEAWVTGRAGEGALCVGADTCGACTWSLALINV